MIQTYTIENNHLVESREGSAMFFASINPDAEERKKLIKDFSIDEHSLSSALDPDEPSRVEFQTTHTTLIFKYPKNFCFHDQLMFKVASLGLFIFPNRILAVMPEDMDLFSSKVVLASPTISYVALKLLLRVIYRFLEHLKVINMMSAEIEGKINTSMENKFLLALFGLEKSLVYYVNGISSNGFSLEKFKNAAPRLNFSSEEMNLLDDITIENNQCLRQAEIYSNILASLMDARASIVSNNLNILIKNLNLITIAIMIPTLVVSAFSMNVHIPMEDYKWAFYIILFFAAVSVSGVLFWWRKNKW